MVSRIVTRTPGELMVESKMILLSTLRDVSTWTMDVSAVTM